MPTLPHRSHFGNPSGCLFHQFNPEHDRIFLSVSLTVLFDTSQEFSQPPSGPFHTSRLWGLGHDLEHTGQQISGIIESDWSDSVVHQDLDDAPYDAFVTHTLSKDCLPSALFINYLFLIHSRR